MTEIARRDSSLWLVASLILLVTVIAGVVVEAGPTAFAAAVLVAITLVHRAGKGDVPRLVVATGLLAIVGIGASLIPTGDACGIPLVEFAQHQMEPTPHVHGPCEQANDRRGLAGVVLIVGAVATATAAARRRAGAKRAI